MARRDLDLKTLLDVPLWERVQDELAKLTGTAIITIDFKGNPITKHSCRTDFCGVIRENPVSRKRCFRCDALAGLEAVRLERPFIYLCHCGIVDVAVPVMVGDKYLGAVMFGQVRIPEGDPDGKAERLVNEISSFQADEENAREDLLEMYQRLPEMEYKRIVEIADLINSIVNYIVDRAIENDNREQTYQWLLRGERDRERGELQELQAAGLPERSGVSLPEEPPVPKSSPVYPAIAYLNDHPQELVAMGDMANLCHLSPSYFSRLFRRETGETFINYMNRQKVQLAKERLRKSNDPVSQIATDLGYMDSSYFINVFKRFEGTTPLVYRQHKYR